MQTSHVQSRAAEHAFCIKDLIAVLVCLSIVLALKLPALGHNKGRSRLTQCLANFQQMGRAWLMYAEDNGGKLVLNPDGSDAGKTANKPSWAGGWLNFTGSNPDNTNTALLSGFNPLGANYGGLLGSYLPSVSVYRCPEDYITVSSFGRNLARVRSCSMNTYMGGRRLDGSLNSWSKPPFRNYLSVNDFANLKSASAFVFVDEREDSINDSVFAMDLTKCLDSLDNVVNSGLWIVDYPAYWHDVGTTLSFADGHAEFWRWNDPRTAPNLGPGQPPSFNVASPNNQDVARLAKATSSH